MAYAKGTCGDCGRIAGRNELYRWSREEKTGRISGTAGAAFGTTRIRRAGGRSSTWFRRTVRFSGGRTLYRVRTYMLCGDCYAESLRNQRRAKANRQRITLAVGVLVMGLFWTAAVVSAHNRAVYLASHPSIPTAVAFRAYRSRWRERSESPPQTSDRQGHGYHHHSNRPRTEVKGGYFRVHCRVARADGRHRTDRCRGPSAMKLLLGSPQRAAFESDSG